MGRSKDTISIQCTMGRKSSPGFPHVNHTDVSPFVCSFDPGYLSIYNLYRSIRVYTLWNIRLYNIAAGAVGDVGKNCNMKRVYWFERSAQIHWAQRFTPKAPTLTPKKLFIDKITLSYPPPPCQIRTSFLFPIFLHSYIYSYSSPIDFVCLLFFFQAYFFYPSTISLIWKQMMKDPWVLLTV